MYLHIGDNQMIDMDDIIAILNMKTAHTELSKGPGKSLIITNKGHSLSSISSKTLFERSKQPWIKN